MNIFKIALPGFGVQNASLDETVLDSLYPSPKVDTRPIPPHAGIIFLNWQSTNLSYAVNTLNTLYAISHGYNYVPTVIANYRFDNGSSVETGQLPFQLGSIGIINLEADRTKVSLKYLSLDTALPSVNIPAFTMKIRYYILAERGYD